MATSFLDVHNLTILNPIDKERELNNIAGVVTVGIFALRPADILVLGGESDLQIIQ